MRASPRQVFFALALLIGFSTALWAQVFQGPFGVGMISSPDQTAEVSSRFEVPIFVELGEHEEFFFLFIHCEFDSSQVEFQGVVTPGPGLDDYIAQFGDPVGCDIVTFEAGFSLFIALAMPFSPPLDVPFIVLPFDVVTDQPGTTEIVFDGINSTTITIVEPVNETPVMRGDVNGDTFCNIADTISILEYLFVPSTPEIPCKDAADLTDDGEILIDDAIFLIDGLFLGTQALPESCEVDATEDALDCSDPSGGC